MAYYSDPNFVAKLQAQRAPGQTFGGPFAATRNAVAQRMQGQSNQARQNTLAGQGADVRYNQAQFDTGQRWAGWNNRLTRASNDLTARRQINYQRQMAYEAQKAARKSRRRGLVGSALGSVASIGGAVLGNMALPGVGGMIGSQIGGQIGGMAGQSF
jgi:hypothetical protein